MHVIFFFATTLPHTNILWRQRQQQRWWCTNKKLGVGTFFFHYISTFQYRFRARQKASRYVQAFIRLWTIFCKNNKGEFFTLPTLLLLLLHYFYISKRVVYVFRFDIMLLVTCMFCCTLYWWQTICFLNTFLYFLLKNILIRA